MHYIQKSILDQLRATSSMRYSAMNVNAVESGHFRYHLKQLEADGLVEQIARGEYRLSDAGQVAVDAFSEGRVVPHEMPKVITYTLLQQGSELYLHRKQKAPYRGLLNMIGGKVHKGETTETAAIREVQEKAGLDITAPELRGVFEVMINKDEELYTHAIAYVYVAELDGPIGHTDIVKIESTDSIHERDDLAPDLLPILKAIQNKESAEITAITVDFSA